MRRQYNDSMTSDERAQLVEDIKKSNKMRQDIVERAERSEDFDIAAAWDSLAELDESIAARVPNARLRS
jgi:hypothetical protein